MLITEILDDQRNMVRIALKEGLEAGTNPRSVALSIVGKVDPATKVRSGGLIGLTTQQSEFVRNADKELASLDRNYFNRSLRDKRYDAMVNRSIRSGKPLSAADRATLTGRYSDRLLKFRGETIARTEAITAMRAATHEGYRQVLESGKVTEDQIVRTWDATGDGRTREMHIEMDGQAVEGMSTPFTAPDGTQLMFPGDTSLGAGGEHTINCRCIQDVRIRYIR
jgi:hypothetical protein